MFSGQAPSPLRFLVLDDPIQAMDDTRVTALARILQDLAARLQVVVWTHDARLWLELKAQRAAVRRLALSREGSPPRVTVAQADSPGRVLLEPLPKELRLFMDRNDARLTPEAMTGMVLAMCRQALDAELTPQLAVAARLARPLVGENDQRWHKRFEDARQTKDRLALLAWCLRRLDLPTWSEKRYETLCDVLNASEHGTAPTGATHADREAWVRDAIELVDQVASCLARATTAEAL